MNRAQRRAHRLLWPLLALAMSVIYTGALIAKSNVDKAAAGTATSSAPEN